MDICTIGADEESLSWAERGEGGSISSATVVGESRSWRFSPEADLASRLPLLRLFSFPADRLFEDEEMKEAEDVDEGNDEEDGEARLGLEAEAVTAETASLDNEVDGNERGGVGAVSEVFPRIIIVGGGDDRRRSVDEDGANVDALPSR